MWNVFGEQRSCVELDLVKVPVKGCVGVHGELFHWRLSPATELSSMYVIQD